MEALEAAIENAELGLGIGSGRSRSRYAHSSVFGSMFGGNTAASLFNAVPMSYNYRQHIVNMDRRRNYKLSTDLHKPSNTEKLMLSLISPLPNEQDFAINVCILMTNEPKPILRLSECPKMLDVLLAHTGVYADYTLRKLFQHVYTDIRRHSQLSFWRDLLHKKPQLLDLYTDEQAWLNNKLISSSNGFNDDSERCDDGDIVGDNENLNTLLTDCYEMDFLNLGRGEGTQDYMGIRVQQVVQILRSFSFFDENLPVLAKSRTLWRFLVMGANIRCANIHVQSLEIAGNVATDFELFDPTTDELSRSLMATLSDGIESSDRAVIINCLEILYKICTKEGNEDNVNKCLNLEFYRRLCLLLSLNDVMMLIFTLEAIYALTAMGARSCSLIMQVRGIVDQLVSLITVEAQSYGPEGCILMRVVEIVPGNMLPMVAQNIANLQNVASIQNKQQLQQQQQSVIVIPQQQQQQVQQTHIETTYQQQQVQQPQIEATQLPINQTQIQPPPPLAQPAITVPILAPPTTVITTAIPSTTTTQSVQPAAQAQSSFTHDDEQYALAWLGATFERAASNESHVEQQELYRMYLAHCQKSGKHSVVNHIQFPRLVRLIFNQSVGPVTVRLMDGTELPGFHYVAIRMRAHPLPLQNKISGGDLKTSPAVKTEIMSARKKKKFKQDQQQQQFTSAETMNTDSNTKTNESNVKTDSNVTTTITATPTNLPTTTASNEVKIEEFIITPTHEAITLQHVGKQTQHQQQSVAEQQQPTTSLIKSLLANKVNQRQLKQKELITTTAAGTITTQQQPIKVPSNAISALVNNPLMQHTPVKVGQTTIKPLNPHLTMEKAKQQLLNETSIPPPPLAPLSGNNVITTTKDTSNVNMRSGGAVIIGNQVLVEPQRQTPPLQQSVIAGTLIKRKLTDDNLDSIKRMNLDSNIITTTAATATTIKENPQLVTPSKNAANLYAEMAASILEDEDLDDIPPLTTTTTTASAAPATMMSQLTTTQSAMIEQQQQQSVLMSTKMQLQQQQQQQQPQLHQTAANVQRQLLFQSNQQQQQHQSNANFKLMPATTQQTQMPTAMATIKTDQGLQTVPVILQTTNHQHHHLQHQQQQQAQNQIIQQVLQQAAAAAVPQQPQQQTQTQYVLATNPQGQTYLVAQQTTTPTPPPPQSTQTVLVTQTPQQQSAGTKTIIILQQQPMPTNAGQQHQQQQQMIHAGSLIGGGGSGGIGQKMIMTTPQGQQVLVTQRPPTPQQQHQHAQILQHQSQQQQQQIYINPQTGTATHIQHVAMPGGGGGGGGNIVTTNMLQRQLMQQHQTSTLTQQQTQSATGQISPSLLSQLNQIPATIKLHQPQPHPNQLPTLQQPQQATISRLGKNVSLIQTPNIVTPPTPQSATAHQIPQLQQHQSIIQQHIISGPSEKRQVLIGGGRAIEIKETVITQAQPPPQQSQLNSQTIITTQQATPSAVSLHQQQQQQQPQLIRNVIEQQQQQHPSIIQQKITIPMQQQPQQQQQQQLVAVNQSVSYFVILKRYFSQTWRKFLMV